MDSNFISFCSLDYKRKYIIGKEKSYKLSSDDPKISFDTNYIFALYLIIFELI